MPHPPNRPPTATAERLRLLEDARRDKNWKRWGPYLAERQWGTVREDYSPDGSCWTYFPHDHARSRAYRWGEDGLLGITDRECRLCFALALWNQRDPILKERLFGLANHEGNHGEDVKEDYFYLDATPTHTYLRSLYKYPQAPFPYNLLIAENARRGRDHPEFELRDTGAFDDSRYFDITAEYAKAAPDDILIRITAANRGPDAAPLHILPTLWFRNTWSWGSRHEGSTVKPRLEPAPDGRAIIGDHPTLGRIALSIAPGLDGAAPELLFTDNQTNARAVFNNAGADDRARKDAFHLRLIAGRADAVSPIPRGTKAAPWFRLTLAPGESATLQLRLTIGDAGPQPASGPAFDAAFTQRIREADEFYNSLTPDPCSSEDRNIVRQACAGLLHTQQFYHYIVEDWLAGDPAQPPPPPQRLRGRNSDWPHLYSRDILAVPDKWEYPWFASWDTAFHAVAFAALDPEFAKSQLLLLLREWYMHPGGQIPAYEFGFGDVNPPVHAWACWRVYKMTAPRGRRDRLFLARAFQKLLINFTWWVNRKDPGGRHLFAGGFLGLDNIGLFDRSAPLPAGHCLEQADGTAWMAFYCGTMLSMALELAQEDPSYEDIASKFFEHFIAIADAINTLGGTGLWDDHDGFYYDHLRLADRAIPLKARSMVGIIPLFAAEVLEMDQISRLPGFKKRMDWFLQNRPDLARHIAYLEPDAAGPHAHRLLAIPSRERLERTLRYLLDESEFLAPFGVRSLSRIYESAPYTLRLDGRDHTIEYAPGDSRTGMFGGNSNWRGPIWLPLNYLLIEALERYHHFYGPHFLIECPTGSGRTATLAQVANDLRARLASIFLPDARGRRPCHGDDPRFAADPNFKDLVLFYEYFNPETGRGHGASHQTGWTALIVPILDDLRQNTNSPQVLEHTDQIQPLR